MTLRTIIVCAVAIIATVAANAQSDEYKTPSADILAVVDAQPIPAVSLDPTNTWMLLMARRSLPPIAALSAPELKLAGLRIDPRTNGPSRFQGVLSLTLRRIADGVERLITGTPDEARIGNIVWSPDGSRIAFSLTKQDGIELWAADLATAKARRIGTRLLNAAIASPIVWMPDSRRVLALTVPEGRGRAPEKPAVPTGPIIQSHEGRSAPARTYQDLLANPYDEDLFDHHATAQLVMVGLDGRQKDVAKPAVYIDYDVSPDGRYILASSIHRPYSYRHQYDRFPVRKDVLDADGRRVYTVADLPLADAIPIAFGSTRTGPRSVHWRSDAPATLAWVEARDDGDAGKEALLRDEVMLQPAPFTKPPVSLVKLPNRYGGLTWGNDSTALVYEWWYKTRQTRTLAVNPLSPEREPRVLHDRSFEDRYSDPGNVNTVRNAHGHSVMMISDDARSVYFVGDGASAEGDRPFVDRLDLLTGATERLWQSQPPYYERPVEIVDDAPLRLVITRESPTERPNYMLNDVASSTVTPLTKFPHPYPQFINVQKEIIHYERDDSVKLTATLYLPAGYRKEDGPLPAIVWAYPIEFKSADAAGQVDDSPYRFNWVSYNDATVFLAKGYAIIDGPRMPIVARGDGEPNDSFVEQLVASARAAVDAAVARGVVDRNRIAVGGHSYGAFMTANLLAHTDLFRAGLARSGAYNRTLTPFGFQSEERSFWKAQDVYNTMSPFNHADKINEPILIVHGGADNNPGTFTMQSERLFEAIKGLGGTARLVVLPHEGHGYRARESVLHVLWETEQWLERWVRNSSVESPKP